MSCLSMRQAKLASQHQKGEGSENSATNNIPQTQTEGSQRTDGSRRILGWAGAVQRLSVYF